VIANLNIRGANGEWIELLRYITPYATACGDSIDVTDFASQLQGKVDISANFPGKSKVTISLIYKEGTPTYKYSWMDKLWLGSYPFGSWTSGGVALQPVEVRQLKLSDTNITAAYLRVLSSGHGWGDNNTGNAAEFYDATHNFKINGSVAFTQHLWRTCNPNPSGCMPQSGTWQYNRAGWCPGSIPMLSRYDVSSRIGNDVNLKYEFSPSYVDLCSAQNPNCITGTTCTDCSNTENPRIMVAGTLVTYFGGVPPALSVDNMDFFNLNVYPNPSKGIFNLSAGKRFNTIAVVKIYNLQGMLVREFNWNGEETILNLSEFSNGIYVMKLTNRDGSEIKKLIIQ
ncbi:MAG: T9SS type A sorting domain-containing protein, partial [Bacteroidales bacterium]